MKKILVILTNTAKYGTKNEATGLWLSEATEFVKELIQAGYVLDYVSPRGGYVPIDPRSLKNAYVNEEVFALYGSEDFQFGYKRFRLFGGLLYRRPWCGLGFSGQQSFAGNQPRDL